MALYPRSIPAQKQLIKEHQVPQFVLGNPQTSVQNSLEFLKKITVVAVSRITEGRKLFPEEAYITKEIEGKHVKILRGVDEIPASGVMVDWVKSTFDLINQQYLKKITLVIQNNISKTGNLQTLEMYVLSFEYDEELICYEFLSKGHSGNIEKESQELRLPADVAASVGQLLRSIDAIIAKLAPLPDCEFGLRLELREDTPDEAFQGSDKFKLIESYDICFPSDVTKWKLGKIPTKFSTSTLSAKSVLFEVEEKEDSLSESEDCIPASQPGFGLREGLSHLKMADELHKKTDCTEIDDFEVSRLQEVTAKHETVKIQKTSAREVSQSEDLYVKALQLCCEEKFISTKKLMEHLKVGRHKAQRVFNKLDFDGCFLLRSGRNGKEVDKDHLNNTVIRRYMKSPNSEEKEEDHVAENVTNKRCLDKEEKISSKFQVSSPLPRMKRQKILGTIGSSIYDKIFSPEY